MNDLGLMVKWGQKSGSLRNRIAERDEGSKIRIRSTIKTRGVGKGSVIPGR